MSGSSRERPTRPPFSHRARPALETRGHSPVRGARCHPLDAALSMRSTMGDGRKAHRADPNPHDLCVPEPPRRRGQSRLRKRLVRRAAYAARGHLRCRHPADSRRQESREAGFQSRRSRSRKLSSPTRARRLTPRLTRRPGNARRGISRGLRRDRSRSRPRFPRRRIRDARIVMTVVGGNIVTE